MEIVMKRIADIKPYPGNPRDNDNSEIMSIGLTLASKIKSTLFVTVL